MNHSMLLGPFAGMGVVIALARAVHGRSWGWGLLAILGLVPLLASGSRVAALAAAVAACFLFLRHKPAIGVMLGLLCLLAIFRFMKYAQSDRASGSFTGALARKGTGNSRVELWHDRIAEFVSSPIIGIGIAMSTGSGTSEDENGDIRVEPGFLISRRALYDRRGGNGRLLLRFGLFTLWIHWFPPNSRVEQGYLECRRNIPGDSWACRGLDPCLWRPSLLSILALAGKCRGCCVTTGSPKRKAPVGRIAKICPSNRICSHYSDLTTDNCFLTCDFSFQLLNSMHLVFLAKHP